MTLRRSRFDEAPCIETADKKARPLGRASLGGALVVTNTG